jgi:hypothetical protein
MTPGERRRAQESPSKASGEAKKPQIALGEPRRNPGVSRRAQEILKGT